MLLRRTTIKYFYDKHISNEQFYLKYKVFEYYDKMMELFVGGYKFSAF